MKLGIIGTRINLSKINFIKLAIFIPENITKIISGGAIGVDQAAEKFAIEKSIEIDIIKPNYSLFGKIAPLVRNTEIIKKSDKIIAFWDGRSKGTASAIKECFRLEKPIEIIPLKNILD